MGSGGSKSSWSMVRSMISTKSRFLDVVGLKGLFSYGGSVFGGIEGCVAAMGKDCELVICGRS